MLPARRHRALSVARLYRRDCAVAGTRQFFRSSQSAGPAMIDFTFQIKGVEVVPLAATPHLCFRLMIESAESCRSVPIQTVLLRTQVRIEPTRRSYADTAAPGLRELFGEPSRWGATMRSMLWTHANVLVPAFVESVEVDLLIECTFDFNVAATKYFASLDEGDVPLCFLFSGTCFYQAERGLQTAQIT